MSAGASNGDAPDGVVARLQRVRHRYDDVVALDDVSLEIPQGRLVGLIGPDGVGKSTLLGLVAGTRRIQSGCVEVSGRDMARPRERDVARAGIAYMAQGLGTNLYPDLSVRENVEFFGRLFGLEAADRARRIDELLEATGLAPFSGRHARKLSGGMKQKLGLCCALIHDPVLLVLDEPTTGVDPLSRRQFWELIDRMRRARPGISVVVATAYMEEARRFDWLAVLHSGSIVATGTPEDVRERAGADSLEAAYASLVSDRERPLHAPDENPRLREDGEIAIEARGLTKRFGDFTAVDRVSFEIRRGEIFGFVGSNGCGKTTTMKMLTGLLPSSEGDARLFGRPLVARDRSTRSRVGFMSQGFSLYGELTVHQNLDLHARLYGLRGDERRDRVAEVAERFGLEAAAGTRAETLPLGVRQRLSLAVALIHRPEVLILDEPTSGVDPMAREDFWAELRTLSRRDGVTIFLSTHFMNEASRCDRIALMHAGRVLATGTPDELVESIGAGSLEDAFVRALEREGAGSAPRGEEEARVPRPRPSRSVLGLFEARRAIAVADRESREILRDRIRLAFAVLGPVILLLVDGYGISFDVEDIRFAVLDRDRTTESRRYLEGFRGSRYFDEQRPIQDDAALDARLEGGEVALAIEMPSGFGRRLWSEEGAEIGIWIDGAMPFKAETTRGYVEGIHRGWTRDFARTAWGREPPVPPVRIEPRFRYNQEFESVRAIVPGVMMLVLMLIPAIMTAVGIVREKELGSIANFYVTPTTRLEFLLGKQLPYVAVGFVSFLVMTALAVGVFRVPVEGSFLALAIGALLYVLATTALGLLISTFVKSQLAAIFATAILTTLPATQFSGLLVPVSSLTGVAYWIGRSFPSSWFQHVSLGVFAKGLGIRDLAFDFAMLLGFAGLYLAAACLLLRDQER